MNIGITCYPTYGGSGVVATELGLELANRGHKIHFICYDRPYKLPHFVENIFYHEVEVSKYPLFDYPPYSLALASQMASVYEDHKLDILHVHYAIPHATSAYLAKKMLNDKVKVVTTLHGTDITIVGADPSFFNITKFAMEKSDIVTSVSEYLKQETIKTFKLEKEIEVVYNSINPDKYCDPSIECNRSYFSPNDEKLLLHISNFRPVKRVLDVIKIAAKVMTKIPAKLIMVGDGPDRHAAEQLAKDLKIEDNVHFLGKQSTVKQFISISDLFLFPSENESFGLAALEAMVCGIPVIGSLSGGLPEVVKSGKSGYLTEPGNVNEMSAYALKLLTDKSLYELFSIEAMKCSRRQFNASKIVPQYENLYQRLIEK